jgi:hypothetical protein
LYVRLVTGVSIAPLALPSYVEVMMDGADGTGKGATGDKDATGKSGRSAKPVYERV